MRRRGEDRFVEHVFPIAGEFLLGDDAGGDRALPAAGAGDHDALADRGRGGLADLEPRHVELGERLNEAEAGLLVVAQNRAGPRAAVVEIEPDRLGFGNQVADGQHQTVAANEYAVTGALGAERLSRIGVGGNDGAQPDHGIERLFEIVAVIFRLRLRGGRHLPVAQAWHRKFPRSQPRDRPLPCSRESAAATSGSLPRRCARSERGRVSFSSRAAATSFPIRRAAFRAPAGSPPAGNWPGRWRPAFSPAPSDRRRPARSMADASRDYRPVAWRDF